MNKYLELSNRQYKEYCTLPTACAFSKEQFTQMMEKWGLTPDDTDKVVHLSSGVYIQKKDFATYKEMISRHEKEKQEAIAADATGSGFIHDMFYHELANHEYGYTLDYDDALAALGYTIDDVEADPKLLRGFANAIKGIIEEAA